MKYTPERHAQFAQTVRETSLCILPDHLPRELVTSWRDAFLPLLEQHVAREGHLKNRGAGRYYVTLPFEGIFAEPRVWEDPDILAIVEQLVGEDFVMCQLATDTPLAGSNFQDLHRDTPPLFPEWGIETPPFQLAVNFPLVDVTPENGPMEYAPGTHMLARADAVERIERGEIPLQPALMKAGDVMIRDVRSIHRGTPNRRGDPRPMVVIGYSRRWLFRPEVSITIPRAVHSALSPRAKHMLRFNDVVDELRPEAAEVYQSFAY